VISNKDSDMNKQRTISIVIPLYNEEAYIETVIERVAKSDTLGMKKEIVVVNDASTDKSLSRLTKIAKKHKLVVVNKKVNAGKGAAIKSGIAATKGDIVLIQDADLEYNPTDYPRLLSPFVDYDADVVYGSRLVTAAPHRVLYYWHYVVNVMLTNLSNMLTNLNLTDMETGYKVFRGDIIRKIGKDLTAKRFGFEPEITARVAKIKNIKIFEVGISYSGRSYEEGKKINWKDGVLAIWQIIYYNLFS
jgi:glycosyltransferase involved in cell wall biosynthesis